MSHGCGYKEYQNTVTKECESCHLTCKQCNGPLSWNCLECDISKFKCIREYGISCEKSREICETTTTTTTTTPSHSTEIPSPTFLSNTYNMIAIFVLFAILIAGIFLFRRYKCSKKSKIINKSRTGSKKCEVEMEKIIVNNPEKEVPTLCVEEKEKSRSNSNIPQKQQNFGESVVDNTKFPNEIFENEKKLDWGNRQVINSGGFGTVYKCAYRDIDGCYYVAVKEAKKDNSNEAFREREMMALLKDHPHIIKLITTKLNNNMLLIMPLRRGSLSNFLENNTKITLTQKIRYCHQIAYGMSHCMFKQIVHCDLKASNVLVVDENTVQICDFGKSQKIDSRNRIIGTITHTALELLDAPLRAVNCEATDVWSFGVTIWEIFNKTKQSPYADTLKNVTEITLVSYLSNGNHLQPTYWPSTDDSPVLEQIATTMLQCWRRKQEDRPTFNYLLGLFFSKLPECNALPFKLNESASITNSKTYFKAKGNGF